MIPVVCHQVEVHLFRRRGRLREFLLIRRSPERTLPGVWQPVTGGIERRETTYAAAAREVREETGLTPTRWWALEHLAVFYEPARDAVQVVPVFAAEIVATDPVLLSHEHDRYAFVTLESALRRVLWESQRCAMRAVRDEIWNGGANAEARDVTARIAAGGRRPRTKRKD